MEEKIQKVMKEWFKRIKKEFFGNFKFFMNSNIKKMKK